MKKQFLYCLFLNPLPGSFLVLGMLLVPLFGLGLTGCGPQAASPVFSTPTDPATSRSFSTIMDDSIILARIKARMISDDFVQGPIDVDVYNGVAYLKGMVETDSQRRMTADLTRGVEGVVRVENQLLVKENIIAPETEDFLISAKIKMALLKDPDIGYLPIEVETTATQVIIKGTVLSQAQKQKITSIARNEAGSRKVVNLITLNN